MEEEVASCARTIKSAYTTTIVLLQALKAHTHTHTTRRIVD